MHQAKAGCLSIAILFACTTGTMSASLTIPQLADLCLSPTVAEVIEKGDRLGWPRASEARLEEWRRSLTAYNKSAAEANGLLEALSAHFGSPSELEKLDFGTSAFWRSGANEIQFTAFGSRVLINIARRD